MTDDCPSIACADIRRAQSAEIVGMRDDAARRRTNENEHRRRAEAALRRQFEHDRGVRGDLFVQNWVSTATGSVWGLIERVRSLPVRPKAADLEQLRDAAEMARTVLRRDTADLDLRQFYDDGRAELLRIRNYVIERGQAIHAELGEQHPDTRGGRIGCTCAGCQLIIGLDDVPLPSLDEAAVS